MANSLKELLRNNFSEDDARKIPLSDLKLISEGKDAEVSRNTLEYIRTVQTDTGALEYLDVGTGLAGALSGAALGTAVAGPIGTVAGGIIGGALGTFGGEVAEDLLAGREVELGVETGGASREALNSLMWDGIFLGGGKIARPVARALGIDPGRMLGAIRSEDKVSDIDKMADLDVSTPEGLTQLNNFLIDKDGGLTLTQTGQAGPFTRFIEGLANIGTFSSKRMTDRIQKNADIFDSEFDSYMNSALNLDPESVGETLTTLIKAGDSALIGGYGAELSAITQLAAGKKVSTQPIIDAINSIPKANRTMIETNLSDQTVKALANRESVLQQSYSIIDPATGKTFAGAKKADVGALIEYQKRFTNMVNDAKPSLTNPKADANLYRELVSSERKIKAAISKTLADIDPDIARAYRELNVWFGRSRNALRPAQISNKIAQAANADAYTSLGKIITTANDSGQVKKLMKSIETSFEVMSSTGRKFPEGVKSADDAKKLMRQAFIAQKIKGDGNILSNQNLSKLIKEFKNPEQNKILKTVLGNEDYVKIKFLAGGLSKIMDEAPSNLLTLAIRGREVSSGANITNALTATAGGAIGGAGGFAIGAGAGAGAGGILGAAAIFGLPVVFSKIALNRKASERLLRLATDVNKFNRKPELIASQVAKVLEALSEEDRKEIASLGL